MRLRDYIIRRLFLSIFVIFGVTIITFILVFMVGNPLTTFLGKTGYSSQMVEIIKRKYGLDKPLYIQYFDYIYRLGLGDWGISLRTHRPVLGEVLSNFMSTLELIIVAIILSYYIGKYMGILSVKYENRAIDHIMRIMAISGVSFPSFWLGLVLIILAVQMGFNAISGRIDPTYLYQFKPITGMFLIDTLLQLNIPAFINAFEHIVLPAITLAAYPAGSLARMFRATMLEEVDKDYVAYSKSYGLPSKIIERYITKNVMNPILTVTGLNFAYYLVGSFYVEWVFARPGLGRLAADSLLSLDYPMIMGITIVVAVFYIIVNLVVDIACIVIDPRILRGE